MAVFVEARPAAGQPHRRAGVVFDRGFQGAGSPARVRALRREQAQGRLELGRAAGQGPSRHDHRSGPGHEPLPGFGRPRGRRPRAGGARVFSSLRADSHPGAAGGRRGALGRWALRPTRTADRIPERLGELSGALGCPLAQGAARAGIAPDLLRIAPGAQRAGPQ